MVGKFMPLTTILNCPVTIGSPALIDKNGDILKKYLY